MTGTMILRVRNQAILVTRVVQLVTSMWSNRLKEQNVTLQATLDEDECRLRMRHAFCRGTVWLSKKMLGALQRGEDKLLRVVAPEGKVDLTARHDAMEAHVQNVQTATEDVFRDLKNQVTSLPTPADVCWMED
ncbi:hypothetical protein BSKO_03302 [Bryopsis sp. KO-2023]|nr:hypothetical protein BSKO_03302 [Bryopsis sp. KO-2023]